MPRGLDGNYILPAGNPVVSGTIIDSGWANPTLDDIAIALSDSLSRSGSGGMLVPFKNADGTLVLPGITFNSEPSLGIYRKAAGQIGFASGGVNVATMTSDGIETVAPTAGTHVATKNYVDTADATLSADIASKTSRDGVEVITATWTWETGAAIHFGSGLETRIHYDNIQNELVLGTDGASNNIGFWNGGVREILYDTGNAFTFDIDVVHNDIVVNQNTVYMNGENTLRFGDTASVDARLFWDNGGNDLICGLRVGSGFHIADVGLNGLFIDPGLTILNNGSFRLFGDVRTFHIDPSNVANMNGRFSLGKSTDPGRYAYFGVKPGQLGSETVQLNIQRTDSTLTDFITLTHAGTLFAGVNAFGAVYGQGPFNDISDRSSKENLRYLGGHTDVQGIIQNLKPVMYDRTAAYQSRKNQCGFIADEIQDVLPDLVSVIDDGERFRPIKDSAGDLVYATDDDKAADLPKMESYIDRDPVMGVGITGLIPYLVCALQEQYSINDELRTEISEIKAFLNM